jgi:hypothetical protein
VDNFNNWHDDIIDTTVIDEYLLKKGCPPSALVSKMRISQCIESLENSISDNKGGFLNLHLPPKMSAMIGQWYKSPVGCNNLSVYQSCHLEQGKEIIYTVKNKLIDMLKSIEATTDEVPISSIIPLVFISHASKDKKLLKLFVDHILKKGLGLKDENIVFTSYEATGVVPGNNIPDYIKKNIKCANVVLAMISSNYKSSEVCMNEVGAAWALDKTPIQIMLPNTNFDKLGWLTHLDKAARIDDRDSLDSLMEEICNKVGLPIPTAKHWNPCTRDFLEALKNLPDLYNDDEPEYSVVGVEGITEINCTPQYLKKYFCEENNVVSPYENCGNLTDLKSEEQTSLTYESFKGILGGIVQEDVQAIHEKINRSIVRINLSLKNNSRLAIENGKIIFGTNDKSISFLNTNVEEKFGHAIEFNMAPIYQEINHEMVTEVFNKPINPSATEHLCEFYISAPHDIGSFKLSWKLESLKEPKYGFITIKWNPEYIECNADVKAGDKRIGTTVIEDYIVLE